MQRDPYFFPFEIVDKNSLIPGDNYYIKLNDNIIRKSVDRRQNIPVSNLKGTFVRLHKEPNRIVAPREYAVFKNVFIIKIFNFVTGISPNIAFQAASITSSVGFFLSAFLSSFRNSTSPMVPLSKSEKKAA